MSNKIRTIIIDDEQLARSITKSYLSKHPEIEIVAECSNGFDAIKKIALQLIDEGKAEGFNIVFNVNKIAGQEVDHVHAHILPRKKDDGLKGMYLEEVENKD